MTAGRGDGARRQVWFLCWRRRPPSTGIGSVSRFFGYLRLSARWAGLGWGDGQEGGRGRPGQKLELRLGGSEPWNVRQQDAQAGTGGVGQCQALQSGLADHCAGWTGRGVAGELSELA